MVDQEAGQRAQLRLVPGLSAEVGMHAHVAPGCERQRGLQTCVQTSSSPTSLLRYSVRAVYQAGTMLGSRAMLATRPQCLSLQSVMSWGKRLYKEGRKHMHNCRLWRMLLKHSRMPWCLPNTHFTTLPSAVSQWRWLVSALNPT